MSQWRHFSHPALYLALSDPPALLDCSLHLTMYNKDLLLDYTMKTKVCGHLTLKVIRTLQVLSISMSNSCVIDDGVWFRTTLYTLHSQKVTEEHKAKRKVTPAVCVCVCVIVC